MNRRRVMTGLLFLFLGVLVTIGVAWACAAWIVTPPEGMRTSRVPIEGLGMVQAWKVSRKEGFGSTQVVAMARSSPVKEDEPLDELLPGWSQLRDKMDRDVADAVQAMHDPANADVIGPVAPTVLMQKGYGWPFRSLCWNWDSRIRTANPDPYDPISRAISLPQRPTTPRTINLDETRALPLGVIPLGFAANTILYAGTLWLVTCGPFALRRYIRRRRGLCQKCGYPLGTSDVCTECGARVSSRRLPCDHR